MPYVECHGCGKSYYVKPYRVGKTKYCSYSCAKNGSLKKCETCGKEFYVSKCHLASRFCSTVCWTTSEESRGINRKKLKDVWEKTPLIGAKNPNWKGGLTSKAKARLLTPEWKNLAKEVLKRDGYRCVYCGSNRGLHVHHIIPWRDGGEDALSNLETLCKHCHPYIEAYRDALDAITKKCAQCNSDNCTVTTCPIYAFRFGKNPYRSKRVMSDEQRNAAKIRLEKARGANQL